MVLNNTVELSVLVCVCLGFVMTTWTSPADTQMLDSHYVVCDFLHTNVKIAANCITAAPKMLIV